jgi:hypothetical protein
LNGIDFEVCSFISQQNIGNHNYINSYLHKSQENLTLLKRS